ncbi:unnamed protein product [Darwinula stevensoni]|uniref:PHD-type domain-containing protein n=1 Tax=Darwinula stevensoni TaxID=69355 RepID=A0A7R9FP88_9CRUS|nr:unnamed protein product [Darwinula stevensoni]CAG0897600.1 unnamed protein product [Darwinula stevensoni]
MVGDEVLSRGKDGCYYLGTVIEVDSLLDKCLIQFDDHTQCWSLLKDLTKFRSGSPDKMCVICRQSTSLLNNELVVCSKCQQSYHQSCHQPKISKGWSADWSCDRCVSLTKSLREEEEKLVDSTVSPKLQLPYDVANLHWDQHHRTNKEQIYCYCGGPGEFYVFVCSLCNPNEKEFVYRLPIRWVDIAHLALFNLTLLYTRKYHEFDSVIFPFVNENWECLQVPAKMNALPKEKRKQNILDALAVHSSRFKSGREVKKSSTIWGLRSRVPPVAPIYSLPKRGAITMDTVKSLKLRGRFRVQRQVPDESESDQMDEDEEDEKMRCSANKKKEVIKESCEPMKKKPKNGHHEDLKAKLRTPPISLKQSRKYALSDPSGEVNEAREGLPKKKLFKCDSAPPVKRPVGRPRKDSLPGRKNLILKNKASKSCDLTVKKAKKLLNDAIKGKNHHVNRSIVVPPSRGPQPEASGDESSRGTLDSFIPPPQNFEGDNNPFCSLGTLHPLLRPTTRQLSEKDIKVTKNGEVRRRYRRRKDALAAYLASRLGHASTHVAAKYPGLSNMGSVPLAASSPPISRSVSHDPNKKMPTPKSNSSVEKLTGGKVLQNHIIVQLPAAAFLRSTQYAICHQQQRGSPALSPLLPAAGPGTAQGQTSVRHAVLSFGLQSYGKKQHFCDLAKSEAESLLFDLVCDIPSSMGLLLPGDVVDFSPAFGSWLHALPTHPLQTRTAIPS